MVSNLDRMRAIDRAWNVRAWVDYGDLLADDLVAYATGNGNSHGKQEHIARAQSFCSVFPDNRVHTEPYLNLFSSQDGTITCSIARITGTMTGPLAIETGVIEPNRRPFDVTFTAICRWKDARIVAQREYFDTELMFSQLQLNPRGR